MRNSLALALLTAVAHAQQPQRSSIKVDLPPDSPVALISADWGESRTSERGSATILNLNTSLSLRNSGNRRIRAISWMVVSQEVTPGGRASVTKASLDIGPGETFPLRVDLRLMRPTVRQGGQSAVEMTLDGVLFDDLSFFGPNRLDSRRAMTAFEMEAQRDRKHFQQVLEARGLEGLKGECLASIARQAELPRLSVTVAPGRSSTPRSSVPGPATATDPERQVQFSFLRLPGAPVEPVAGMARVAGNEAWGPRLEVRNLSRREVRYLEIGWILSDARGREVHAGAVPARTSLAPGSRGQVAQDSAMRFAEPSGDPVAVGGMTGFVSQVEFADGSVWVPSRVQLDDPRLRRALGPSAEEQRLTNIYKRRGAQALIDELKKF
jgi:hypothetical protein